MNAMPRRPARPVEEGPRPKEWGRSFRVALIYPNSYRIGMGNLGVHAVYRAVNSLDGFLADRFFFEPGQSLKPVSVERDIPPSHYDCLAFSLHFEPDYAAIPGFLRASGMKTKTLLRTEGEPFVIAGGPAVSANPEPVAEFLDAIYIGEFETGGTGLLRILKKLRERGDSRGLSLESMAEIPHVYVPSLASFSFDGPKTSSFTSLQQLPVEAAHPDLAGMTAPSTAIYSRNAEFSDMNLVELSRGCTGGCRFCMAGFTSRPYRCFDTGSIIAAATGERRRDKVGLIGELFAEHPGLIDINRALSDAKLSISPSSVRLESLTPRIIQSLVNSGQKTLTLAPETASERLSRAINKPFDRSRFVETVRLSLESGLRSIRLYFIVGFPGETDADVESISDISREISFLCASGSGKSLPGKLTVSVNPFIPKPWTPLQWEPFASPAGIEFKYSMLSKGLAKAPGLELRLSSYEECLWEAVLARSDRRASVLVESASAGGWRRVLKSSMSAGGGDLDAAFRAREPDEPFPWETVFHGCKRSYLFREKERFFTAAVTPRCDTSRCRACGACGD